MAKNDGKKSGKFHLAGVSNKIQKLSQPNILSSFPMAKQNMEEEQCYSSRSGCSSRNDSFESIEDAVLMEKIPKELKVFVND